MLLNQIDLYPLKSAINRAEQLHYRFESTYEINGLKSASQVLILRAMKNYEKYKIEELQNLKGHLIGFNGATNGFPRTVQSINGIEPARNACKYNRCKYEGKIVYNSASKRINTSAVDKSLIASMKESLNYILEQVVAAEKRKALNPEFSILSQLNNIDEAILLLKELANEIVIQDYIAEQQAPLLLPQHAASIVPQQAIPTQAIPDKVVSGNGIPAKKKTEEVIAPQEVTEVALSTTPPKDNNILIGGITVGVVVVAIAGGIYFKKKA